MLLGDRPNCLSDNILKPCHNIWVKSVGLSTLLHVLSSLPDDSEKVQTKWEEHSNSNPEPSAVHPPKEQPSLL